MSELNNNPCWKAEVRDKLNTTFGDDEEGAQDQALVLMYLNSEEVAYRAIGGSSPTWESLRRGLSSDLLFKAFATRLKDDVKRAKNDPQFRSIMNELYKLMLEAGDLKLGANQTHTSQGFGTIQIISNKPSDSGGVTGFARAWGQLSNVTRAEIIQNLPHIISENRQILVVLDDITALMTKYGATAVVIGLAALMFCFDVCQNFTRWWCEEISGKRLAKNIIDSGLTIVAGMGGGAGGAAVGAMFGGVGILAGGIVGGYLSSKAAAALSDRLTQTLFDIPKEEAVERSYKYFELTPSAGNEKINGRFHQLCRQHHPDKGGSTAEMAMVNGHMALIKLSRTGSAT